MTLVRPGGVGWPLVRVGGCGGGLVGVFWVDDELVELRGGM